MTSKSDISWKRWNFQNKTVHKIDGTLSFGLKKAMNAFQIGPFFFWTEFYLLPPIFFLIISSVDIIDKRSTFIFVLKRLFNLQGQSGEDQKGTENCRPDKQQRVFSWTCFLRGAQTLFLANNPTISAAANAWAVKVTLLMRRELIPC